MTSNMQRPNDLERVNESHPAWFVEAFSFIKQLCSSVQPPLADRMAQFCVRWKQMNGGNSLETALSSSLATPGPALMEALRHDLGISLNDTRLSAIARGTLALYYYVRVQDDIVDEPKLFDRGYVYVAEVFSGASVRAFAEVLADYPHFFAFHESTMRAFASAATWEIDVYRQGLATQDDLVRIGQKFLPMVIPLGALALLADNNFDLDALVEFVTCFGTGLQMLNDILNIKEDHIEKRLTPILRWLYEGGRATPSCEAQSIRLILLSDTALEQGLNCAREAIARAELIALKLRTPELAAIVRHQAALIESIPTQLLAFQFNLSVQV